MKISKAGGTSQYLRLYFLVLWFERNYVLSIRRREGTESCNGVQLFFSGDIDAGEHEEGTYQRHPGETLIKEEQRGDGGEEWIQIEVIG